MELKSVIEDYRMHSLGGISSGLDIFNMAILPVMLNNSATWIMMNKKTINKLENLQHVLQRCLLGAANSTPLVAMSWDLGMLNMEHRVNQSKLVFLKYLVDQDDTNLSKEISNIQKSLDFPGFIEEARELLTLYKLPNIIDEELKISYSKWKVTVKRAVKNTWETELKESMTTNW